MDKQMKDMVCKLIDNEIEKISKMPSLNDAALANLYKLVDVKKDLLEIDEKEMNMYGDMGNSIRYMPNSYRQPIYDSYRGMSYDMPGYRGGYSMDNQMMQQPAGGDSYMHLEEAMRNAKTEPEREAIRQVMNKLYK